MPLAGALVLAALALLGPAARLLGAAAPPLGSGQFRQGTHDGRAYRLYVPASGSEPRPLVVALHGCGQTPEDFATGTRLNEAAERRGLLVLYPAQGRRDNPSRCWNWFADSSRERGEPGALLGLVQRVQGEYRVARDRTVVVGISAGGFMAVNLACEAPDLIVAVGVMAGGPYRCGIGVMGSLACMRGQHVDGEASGRACLAAMGPRARTVRASLWHGADDTVVSPLNLDALERMFALVDHAGRGMAERAEQARHTVYRDGSGRRVLESWLVSGMGHAWSGGDPRGSHTYPAGPPATDLMLDFLLASP